MTFLTEDRVFPRPFTHGRDLFPPYGGGRQVQGETSAGGQSVNVGGLMRGDLILIDYIIN